MSAPTTILDEERVRRWLVQAGEVDGTFCNQVRFAILESAVGYALSEKRLAELQVSTPV